MRSRKKSPARVRIRKLSEPMIMDTCGKADKIRLRLFYSQFFFGTASRIPTGRQCRQDSTYRYTPTKEVWKALRPYLNAGMIQPSSRARELLDRMRREYTQLRLQIRRSASLWKREDSTKAVLPMKTKPFDHQRRAFGFATTLDNPALLMDMGTGKTYVALAVAGYRHARAEVKRVLWVTLKSAVHVPERDLKKHADFPFTITKSTGGGPLVIPEGPGVHVMSINFHRAARLKKQIVKWKPDLVIVDESQKIQSRKSSISKALYFIGDRSRYRMILTGSLIGQTPLTAWSQYRFLDRSILGSDYGSFESRYCIKGGYMNFEIKGFKKLEEFSEKIHSVAFRTTKAECLDLPPILYTSFEVECPPKLRKIYNELDLNFVTQIGDETVEVERRVSAISKLRQLVSGLVKSDGGILIPVSEAKAGALAEQVELKDWAKKLVVFTVFNHEIDIVMEVARKAGIKCLTLTGKTKNREEVNRSFQESKSYDMIAVQVQTGGAAIDLFAADQAWFYSPTFSFIDYTQAKDRIHRIGQDSPCTIGNFIMKGTVDEDIAKLIESTGGISKLILDDNRDYRLKRSKR